MASRFPLQQTPECYVCGSAATLNITQSNKRGNFLRPYYNCKSGHVSKFITWNDDRDVYSDNPHCSCGYPSRRHQGNGPNAGSWLACSAKQCAFNQELRTTEHVAELGSTPQTPDILHQERTVYPETLIDEPAPQTVSKFKAAERSGGKPKDLKRSAVSFKKLLKLFTLRDVVDNTVRNPSGDASLQREPIAASGLSQKSRSLVIHGEKGKRIVRLEW